MIDESDNDAGIETLFLLITRLFPEGRRSHRVDLAQTEEIDADQFRLALEELKHPGAAAYVDGYVIVALLEALDQFPFAADEVADFSSDITGYVRNRWNDLSATLARQAIGSPGTILGRFPQLCGDPAMMSELARAISDEDVYDWHLEDLVAQTEGPSTIEHARPLVDAARKRGSAAVATAVLTAIANNIGQRKWAALFGILMTRPDYAEDDARFERQGDAGNDGLERQSNRIGLAQLIGPLKDVRAVAKLLLELIQPRPVTVVLLEQDADAQEAYLKSLRRAIGADDELRHACIEALLWLTPAQLGDRIQATVTGLFTPNDRGFLEGLQSHPDPQTRTRASGRVSAPAN